MFNDSNENNIKTRFKILRLQFSSVDNRILWDQLFIDYEINHWVQLIEDFMYY